MFHYRDSGCQNYHKKHSEMGVPVLNWSEMMWRVHYLVSDDEESQPSVHDTQTPNCLVQLYVMFLFMWQMLFRVSDTGMNILLLITKFLSLVTSAQNFITKFLSLVTSAQNFIDQLPSTIAAARKLVGINRDNFFKYASCPSCHIVYP